MPSRPEFITISEMASVLNYEFGCTPKIAKTTPYEWWKRNKKGEMKVKMPRPYRSSGNSVLFRRNEIIDWYGKWKGLKPLYLHTVEDEVREKVEELLEQVTGADTRKRRKRG